MNLLRLFCIALALTSSLSIEAADSTQMTGLQVAHEAARYVGEQSRPRVLEVRAEKTKLGQPPTRWVVAFYNEPANLKRTEVEFEDGKLTRIVHSTPSLMRRLVELNPADTKIDSPEAVTIASKIPEFGNIKVSSAAPILEGDDGRVVWRVKLWGAKLLYPEKEAEIGDVLVSGDTGQVLKKKLKLDRLN